MQEQLRKELKILLKTDVGFRKEVISEIVADKSFIDELSREIFSTKAQDVGINAPGTISEFFCKRFTQNSPA